MPKNVYLVICKEPTSGFGRLQSELWQWFDGEVRTLNCKAQKARFFEFPHYIPNIKDYHRGRGLETVKILKTLEYFHDHPPTAFTVEQS